MNDEWFFFFSSYRDGYPIAKMCLFPSSLCNRISRPPHNAERRWVSMTWEINGNKSPGPFLSLFQCLLFFHVAAPRTDRKYVVYK